MHREGVRCHSAGAVGPGVTDTGDHRGQRLDLRSIGESGEGSEDARLPAKQLLYEPEASGRGSTIFSKSPKGPLAVNTAEKQQARRICGGKRPPAAEPIISPYSCTYLIILLSRGHYAPKNRNAFPQSQAPRISVPAMRRASMASARSICPYRMPDDVDALGEHRGLFEQRGIAGERDPGDRLLVRGQQRHRTCASTRVTPPAQHRHSQGGRAQRTSCFGEIARLWVT